MKGGTPWTLNHGGRCKCFNWAIILKATPGCLQGFSAPWITSLFHCHKQLCWTIIIPWSYIVMVLPVCRYVADEPPLPYSSNWLHHLYHSQILTCSSVRKVLVPKFHSILISFNRPPWGSNTQGMVGRNFEFHFFTEITMVNVKKITFFTQKVQFLSCESELQNFAPRSPAYYSLMEVCKRKLKLDKI